MVDMLLYRGFAFSSHPLLAFMELLKPILFRKAEELIPRFLSRDSYSRRLIWVAAMQSFGLCRVLEPGDLRRAEALVEFAKALCNVAELVPDRQSKSASHSRRVGRRKAQIALEEWQRRVSTPDLDDPTEQLRHAYDALERAKAGLNFRDEDEDTEGSSGWMLRKEVDQLVKTVRQKLGVDRST